MKKLFLLVPLLFAQPPAFLLNTLLPPQFTLVFANVIKCEIASPPPAANNQLYYLETEQGVRYMKSYFAQSALIPGAPVRFKDTSVWWLIAPDPAHGNLSTARVYSVQRKEWALVAVNLGPPRRDLVARYYAYFPLPPVSAPTTPVPVGNPPNGAPVQWFYTSGTNAPPAGPVLSSSDQGYFAMLVTPVTGPDRHLYKPPYSLIGGGAGALHQAYGQLLYQQFNLSPKLTPASFTPPSGYQQIGASEMPIQIGSSPVPGNPNCSVCHYTDPKYMTTLYQPVSAHIDCTPKK